MMDLKTTQRKFSETEKEIRRQEREIKNSHRQARMIFNRMTIEERIELITAYNTQLQYEEKTIPLVALYLPEIVSRFDDAMLKEIVEQHKDKLTNPIKVV